VLRHRAVHVLVAIPHFYRWNAAGKYGSERAARAGRAAIVAECLRALYVRVGQSQLISTVLSGTLAEAEANQGIRVQIDVVVCTTGDDHLLDALPTLAFRHHDTSAEPRFLGYECHQVLADALGSFDYYCYLEDDLAILDPLFFCKLRWFTATFGENALLLPNRYTLTSRGKHYFEPVRARDPNRPPSRRLSASLMGLDLSFREPRNLHSGCFFLTETQMRRWSERLYFMDRSDALIGPLESAATLGIGRTFALYKPFDDNAGFLELHDLGRT
jgi:hypothetical protein